jgi:hypothetical protein
LASALGSQVSCPVGKGANVAFRRPVPLGGEVRYLQRMAKRAGARTKAVGRAADNSSENVFLTWSGPRSKDVAEALKKWLPGVVQHCQPWMSKDIQAGKRWRSEIKERLNSISVGILCLTKENVGAPWVNFEAGALSKSVVDENRVIPYCFAIKPTDYADPLGDFQGVTADHDGTWSLVRSVNSAMPAQVEETVLLRVFEGLWPSLEADLAKVAGDQSGQAPSRSTESLLEEILTRVRQLEHGNARNYYFDPGPIGQMLGEQAALSLRALADLSDRGVKLPEVAYAQVRAYKAGLRAAAEDAQRDTGAALGVDLKDMRAPDPSDGPPLSEPARRVADLLRGRRKAKPRRQR